MHLYDDYDDYDLIHMMQPALEHADIIQILKLKMSLNQVLFLLLAILLLSVTSTDNCRNPEAVVQAQNSTCINLKLCSNTEVCSYIIYPACGKISYKTLVRQVPG